MSRHRNFRNMDYDDYNDDYEEDDYEEEEEYWEEEEDTEVFEAYDPQKHKAELEQLPSKTYKHKGKFESILKVGFDGKSAFCSISLVGLVPHCNIYLGGNYFRSKYSQIIKQVEELEISPAAVKPKLISLNSTKKTGGLASLRKTSLGLSSLKNSVSVPTKKVGLSSLKKTSLVEPPKGNNQTIKEEPSKKQMSENSKSFSNKQHTILQTDKVESPVVKMDQLSIKARKKIDIKSEYSKRQQSDQRLNLVVVGHVDAGKSTLMGHVLMLLGEVSQRTVMKYKSQAGDKSSFCYAWVLDATDDERSRGVTIDVGVSQFKTKKRIYTLLDAPGHKDFIPNMISGTSQADVAVLVVDASTGEFESGFAGGGQTREHARLVKSLGVTQLIIAVNKMDNAKWSQDRFEYISLELTRFLVDCGFSKNDLNFVPCSGFSGENLKTRTKHSWYQGPTFIESLDLFEETARDIDGSFTMSVQDYYKGGVGPSGAGSVTVCGRISSGNVQIGDSVLALPINEIGTVKAMNLGEDDVKWAVAGDRVSITFNGLDVMQLHLGTVLCEPSNPISVATTIRAEIRTFDLGIPLTIGVPVVFHHLGTAESAFITQLESVRTESGDRKWPRSLRSNQTAVVIIKLNRPTCLQDKDGSSKELSRFLLRRSSESVAAGTVLEIIAEK